MRAALLGHEPDRPERLVHAYYGEAEPVSLLIEEVEAIWEPIAEADDWSAFDSHMSRIDAARVAREVP